MSEQIQAAHTAQPFDAATLELHGLHLIEASAGTGKTFSLAGLYLRLIIENNASVRDILVMTFTRAATQELRERIRARLADAARIAHHSMHAKPGHGEHDFTLQIIDQHISQSGEDRAALTRRLAEAAARVDEATIVTIHGFAQRAAAENAFESALAFDRGDPVDDASLYRQAAADYWRAHVFGGRSADVLALWPSPDALYDAIREVLSRPHARLAGIDKALVDRLQNDLAQTWPGTAEPLATALANAFAADALLRNDRLYSVLAAADDIAERVSDLDTLINSAIARDTIPTLPDWVTALGEPATQFKKRPASCQAYAEPLANLAALPVLAELQPLAGLMAIEQATIAVRALAAERKIERRQYSYDDLIAALHQALTAPTTGAALADALHARWPYALVDEFQDTDPLQYASLARIYLDRPRDIGALLLIGDPKQAIYGFRGGDIYAYLAAADAAGPSRYTLTTNFRSTQGLLDGIQALFALPAQDPFVVPEIDFPHVKAGRPHGDRRLVDVEAQAEQSPMTFWRLDGSVDVFKNGKRRNPNKNHDNDRLIAETLAAVARLLDGQSMVWRYEDGTERPVAARDVAILVNKHAEATELQAALAHRGIMAVCQQRNSVFASPQAQDLRLVLRAMATPDDATAVRAAQPTGLLGKRLADLIELADNDTAMQRAILAFQDLHQAWVTRGVLSALEALFLQAAPSVLALTDGERRMSNYLQLGELLARAESQCFGMVSLVRWLDRQVTAAFDGTLGLEDDSQLRLESDADLVRISTVHSAKGLQYPIVFLPFARWLGTAGSPDKPPLIFHPQPDSSNSNHSETVADSHAAGRHANQPATHEAMIDLIGANPAHVKQAVVEARSEALRLLYVALTRAEQALIVGWREPDSYGAPGALGDLLYRDGHGLAEANALNTLAAAHPAAFHIQPIDTAQSSPVVATRAPVAVDALIDARHNLPSARPRWSTYSFSRLAHAAVIGNHRDLPAPGAEDELAAAPADALAPDDAGHLPTLDNRLSGVRFGSAVHDVLETTLQRRSAKPRVRARDWPRPGGAPMPDADDEVATTLRRYGLIGDADPTDNTRTDPRIPQTTDLVARTLHTPLPGIGPLAGLDPEHVLTEMEFMLRLRRHRLGALIDTLRDAGYLPAALGGDPQRRLYGLMQGFIDLVVEVGGVYVILDYKTNRLGDTPAAYRDAPLANAIGRSHYDLQYLIYTVALHRHLRQCLPDYNPAVHLGGVQYLFVRAMDGETSAGVFIDRPDAALVEALDALFDAEASDREATA